MAQSRRIALLSEAATAEPASSGCVAGASRGRLTVLPALARADIYDDVAAARHCEQVQLVPAIPGMQRCEFKLEGLDLEVVTDAVSPKLYVYKADADGKYLLEFRPGSDCVAVTPGAILLKAMVHAMETKSPLSKDPSYAWVSIKTGRVYRPDQECR
jgi:hypothetical protein